MRFVSLKTKMTIAVTLMVMLTLSVVAYFSLTHFERAFTQTTARQQFVLVTSLAEEIDLNIDLAQQELIGMARALSGTSLDDPAALQTFLEQSLQNEPLFDGALGVIAANGIMLAVAPLESDMVGRDFSFRPYFSETVATGQPRISAPFISAQKNGHPIVMFTAPIFDQQGKLTAVVVGAVDLLKDNFLGRIARMRLGEGGYLYVYASDRTIIVHPDPSRILQQDVPLGVNPLFDRAIEGFEGAAETVTSRGMQAFSSFKHLKTRDWILAANYPLAEVFAPMANARRYILALLAAGTLVSLLGTWLLMRHLTAPLLVFTACVKNMTERESDRTPIALGSRDEIDTLAQAFNYLLEETDNRKRALEDNLVFHQVLINTLPVPVFIKDIEGRYVGCNIALTSFLGLSKEQLLGKTAFEIAPPQLAERYHQADMDLRGQDGIQVYEGRIARADGGQRDVVFTKANFVNALGQRGGIVGAFLDITEHKRIERDLAEQKEFSENLLQNSPVASFVLDPQHRVISWNRACEELTGVKAAEMLGTRNHWRPFYDHQRPCLADLVLEGTVGASSLYPNLEPWHLNPEGVQAEGWFPDLNGNARYLVFNAAPIRGPQGEMLGSVETLQDLTSRRLAEESLQRSRDHYLTILEEFPALIWRSGLDGACDYFNKTWLDFTGRSLEQELGVGWSEGVHSEDRERCLATYLEHFREQLPFSVEYRLRRLDGDYRWIIDMGRPYQDLDGHFAGYIGVCFDLTEHRQSLERLKVLSRAIEQSPSAVVITDAAGTPEYVNPQFVRQTGFGLDEARTQSHVLDSRTFAPEARQQIWETIESGRAWQGEFLNVKKSGESYWESASISPILDETGSIRHYVGIKEDITEKRKLQESQHRRRVMGQAATEALRTFLSTSSPEAMAKIMVGTCADLLGAGVAYLAEKRGEQLRLLAAAGPTFNVNSRALHEARIMALVRNSEAILATEHDPESPEKLQNLEPVAGTALLLPLRIAGEQLGVIGLLDKPAGFPPRDREDMKFIAETIALVLQSVRAEQARGQAADHLRVVQKFEAIGQLAGGVAHDFNNLLTVINGYSSLLVRALGQDSQKKQDAELILEAGRKAENLVRQMLAFSRRQVMTPVLLNLNELIDNFRNLLLGMVREDIELKFALAEDLGRVKADPGQMEQILINLVVNARDAMQQGGQITIGTRNLNLDDHFVLLNPGATTGATVVISVEDTGSGMPEAVRERIFEPFFTTKEPGRGTGLGLSTVYGIVKQSGGYINVASEPGRGTMISVFLPRTDATVAASSDQDKLVPTALRGTVLLVEDQLEVLSLTVKILEEQGLTVLGVDRPEEALRQFRENPAVDLLLTDMVMPEMSGMELGRRLRQQRPELKVLFMSGYGQFHNQELGQAGMALEAGFLQKPFTPEDLVRKVFAALA